MRSTEGASRKVLCYAFDKSVGNTKEILLFSLRTIREAKIDIIHHMDQSHTARSGVSIKVLGRSVCVPEEEENAW